MKKDYEILAEMERRAFQVRKPSKQEVINIIRGMARVAKTEDGMRPIVRLYAYFNGRPAAPKKAKTAFDYVARAVSTDPTREFMQVVIVNDFRIVATDGRRLHIADNVDGMKPGKYTAAGLYLEPIDGNKHGTYPNIDNVLKGMEQPTEHFTVWLENLESEPDTHMTIIEPKLCFRVGFNLRFLEQASLNNGCVRIAMTSPNKAATVTDDTMPDSWRARAIIMPMDLR